MTAIILAAGVGSRMQPLTESLPKCLLPAGGTPLLERTLTALGNDRVDRAVIVTGYLHKQVEAFAETLALPFPVYPVFNPRFRDMNNNYSLWCAAPACRGEAILLLDSDILFHPLILDRLFAAPQDNALALREDSALTDEEIKVTATPEGRVIRIGKDLPPRTAAGESLGIERFSPDAATRLFTILSTRRERNEFYEASFQQMVDEGTLIQAVGCGSLPCMEIDTPDDLDAAENMALEIDR